MQRVLVTGGAGFIGSHLVEELVRRSYKVRVLDNFFRGKSRNSASCACEVKLVVGDITDPDVVKRAMDGVDCPWGTPRTETGIFPCPYASSPNDLGI